jgi:hypothetical protein
MRSWATCHRCAAALTIMVNATHHNTTLMSNVMPAPVPMCRVGQTQQRAVTERYRWSRAGLSCRELVQVCCHLVELLAHHRHQLGRRQIRRTQVSGGCGSYSAISCRTAAVSGPISCPMSVRAKSTPAVTPPPVMRLRPVTTRLATLNTRVQREPRLVGPVGSGPVTFEEPGPIRGSDVGPCPVVLGSLRHGPLVPPLTSVVCGCQRSRPTIVNIQARL